MCWVLQPDLTFSASLFPYGQVCHILYQKCTIKYFTVYENIFHMFIYFYEHISLILYVDMFSCLLDKHLEVQVLNRMVIDCTFNFIRNFQTVFQNSCTILLSHQQCSSFSPFLPTFAINSLVSFSRSSFHLHFLVSDDVEHLYVLIGHSCIFFGYVSINILGHFVLLSWLSSIMEL